VTPSQLPEQLEPSAAQASRVPCGAPTVGVQVPWWPAMSHAWHCPLHAWSQHRPSTQKLLAHWSAAPQAAPDDFCGWHTPPPHQLPGWQSLSTEQLPLHWLAPHT
jgi:hypothetical protein